MTLLHRFATLVLLSHALIGVGFRVRGQQFAILAPPGTPTSLDVLAGPPPSPANLTARPLPPVPSSALGQETFNVGNVPPDGVSPIIALPSNMLGLSLELSVANKFVGDKINEPAYQLLNYLNSIRARAGRGAVVRIGGNTQDTAEFSDRFTGVIEKSGGGVVNGIPVTPKILFGDLLLHLIAQIAAAVDAEIVLGVNMVDKDATFSEVMLQTARRVLGQSLKYILVGNEPDRYTLTGRRPSDYSMETYVDEWGDLTSRMIRAAYVDSPKQFAGPSVCCQWSTQQLLDGGMVNRYLDRLAVITAVQYPQSMCSNFGSYGHEGFANHSNVIQFSQYDADAVTTAIALNVPYVLVETNTASCIGVPDVSDTFTAAIWAVNTALQLGYRNHSGVLLHSGGQSSVYNTFTPPAYNASNRIVSARAWRTGPVFYSTLVLAEALRASDDAALVTVTDQQLGNDLAVAYNVYENGLIAKKVFLNMANDPSGANDMHVTFPLLDGQGASSVPYKLLSAPSLAEKDNITWAGQTFGWWSEGILKGEERIMYASCTNAQCALSIPAPSIALVFVSQGARQRATVTATAFHPVGTQNPQIVLHSNGERGRRGGATSKTSALSTASHTSVKDTSIFTLLSLFTLSILLFVYM